MESAQIISYAEIAEGMTRERDYVITPAVYENFLRAFDDRSPIHVDEEHARAKGFAGRVMHGGIVGGFVSHFIGMFFPGAHSLLLSAELRFVQPSYLGDTLRLSAKVAQKLDAQQVVVLHFKIHNQTRGVAVATARAQVKVMSP
ncbi:MAG: MaoC family dehydratase N-terminal domain-containing protein [Verrucomicrobia bacterium]|nr:MaoC family dehydratase N-terminal domain-containing protein [Verrucomicrobiota bacterium]